MHMQHFYNKQGFINDSQTGVWRMVGRVMVVVVRNILDLILAIFYATMDKEGGQISCMGSQANPPSSPDNKWTIPKYYLNLNEYLVTVI